MIYFKIVNDKKDDLCNYRRYCWNLSFVEWGVTDKKTDQQKIISLLHAFSMRMYLSRRKKIKEALEEKGGENDS